MFTTMWLDRSETSPEELAWNPTAVSTNPEPQNLGPKQSWAWRVAPKKMVGTLVWRSEQGRTSSWLQLGN